MRYLESAAEIQAEAKETQMAAGTSDDREGGTGTRAKGDEGAMGNPESRSTNRYGVAGPSDPHVSRQAALRDAAEFGMIGLMNSGAAGAPDAPTAPWGRDDSLGAGAPVRTPIDAPPGRFADYGFNAPVDPSEDAMSTFAVDVDTGSFPIVRRSLENGQHVMRTSVRPEEIINYFDYGYPGPTDGTAFAAHLHAAPSPFDAGHHVVRVGLQARRAERQVPAHLVYLVDTSGSMQSPDKIGLVKQSLRMLTNNLRPGDTVALCTYAGSVRVVLPPTGIAQRQRILAAIEQLSAGGSTAMGSGIKLAYDLAESTRVPGHINRVVVLSDGDANVGLTSHERILEAIDAQRKKGITLSTVGVGTGNYNDVMMEQLANEGDGNYQYVDDAREARRVFVDQLDGMLEVVAKDVKIQVEFDPSVVASYRLIGYENRDVADEDFRDDAVDGGEIGAGHNVTAVYDVVLKNAATARSWVTLRVRHKQPHGDEATEQVFHLDRSHVYASFEDAHRSLRFATAAAGFAEVLRESPYAEGWTLDRVAAIATSASDGTEVSNQLAELARRARILGQG
ncbi:MAG TPA: VWA domain-containing protein [Polyangiaceae bacterium]|nr:VWA domain-containing protein [Polyangiaceae bacterium]